MSKEDTMDPMEIGSELIQFIQDQELAYLNEYGFLTFTGGAAYEIGQWIANKAQSIFEPIDTLDPECLE